MSLDASEATQYDRQIRLWGLEAQKRIRAARVLVFGAGGLSVETCKNLVLAGVKALTLADTAAVTQRDLTAQFFLHQDDLTKNRAEATAHRLQTLNPKVEVSTVTNLRPSDLSAEHLSNVDVVIATQGLFHDMVAVDELCRSNNVKFYYGFAMGFFGFFFQDLGHHDFLVEKKSVDVEDTATSELKSIDFLPWSSVLQHSFKGTRRKALPVLFLGLRALHEWQRTQPLPETCTQALMDHVTRTFTNAGTDASVATPELVETLLMSTHAELCTSTSVVGGVLAGEVIKAVSGKDEPLNNCFCFDGFESAGKVFELGTATAATTTAPPQAAQQPAQGEEVIEL